MPAHPRSTIAARLAAVLAACLIAVVAIALVGVVTLRSVEDREQRIVQRDIASLDAAHAVVAASRQAAAASVRALFLHADDLDAQATDGQQVEDAARRADRAVERLRASSPDALDDDVDELVRREAAFADVRDRVLLAARSETERGAADHVVSRRAYEQSMEPALDELEAASDRVVRGLERETRSQLADAGRDADRTGWLVAGLALLAAVISSLLGRRFVASLRRPLDRLRRASESVAAGDVDSARLVQAQGGVLPPAEAANGDPAVAAAMSARMPRDEAACVELAFAHLVAYVLSAARVAERLATGDTAVAIEARSAGDRLGHALVALRDSAARTADAARRIAGGERELDLQVRGEHDELGRALAGLLDDLRSRESERAAQAHSEERRAAADSELLDEVARRSAQLLGASSASERTAGEVTAGMEEVARATGELAATAQRQVEVLGAAVHAAEAATSAAESTSAVVVAGVDAVDRASGAMTTLNASAEDVSGAISELAAKSARVGDIVATITAIADQTNLLALNAAIEAARAGEQGRGFAVVADEVRKLAEESQRSAAQISAIVVEIQHETQRTVTAVEDSVQRAVEGSATVSEARSAFLEIERSVGDVLRSAAEIRTSTQDAVGLAQTSSAQTEQVSAATQQTAASMQEVAATATELNRLADAVARAAARGDDALLVPVASAETAGPPPAPAPAPDAGEVPRLRTRFLRRSS